MKKSLYMVLFTATLWLSCSKNGNNDDAVIAKRVDSVMKLMTLEEKIGQLNLLTSDWDVTGPTLNKDYLELIKKGSVGAIFNAHTAAYTRKLQKIAVEETRLKIPLIFGYDVIHGYRTIFPISLGESASWDLEAIELAAKVAAIEASAAGLHWTFAPMVDIARDPRWGRVSEGAGEDTYLGSMIAQSRVLGFQGTDFKEANSVLACVKHYAAYGAALAGRDYNTVDMSDRVLRETYLPPYKAAIDAGAYTVMTAFNEVDGTPATANKYLLDKILRKEWGFKGFVVTDYTSINEMVNHGNVKDQKNAAEMAINAGVDMDMQSVAYFNYLKALVDEGKVKEAQIDQSVRNILTIKFKLGLFDDPYRFCNEEREKKLIYAPEHIQASRDVARKSIVLLKNNNNVLPIGNSVKTIAVIGPLADTQKEVLGSWRAAGEDNRAVSLLMALKDSSQTPVKILYEKGCNTTGGDKSGFEKALAIANQADVILVALGEDADLSGEASCRTNITIPGVQSELLQELKKTGKPIVLVLMNGRPLALTNVVDYADAILETWFLGTQAGNAICDVLFGRYNPSGKLPITFPRSVGQVPLFYNHKNTGRPFNEKNKYTTKYLDISNDPLFPFGFGLSYSTFAYSDLKLNSPQMKDGDTLTVSVTVSNTGRYDGTEMVQLYIRDLVGSVTRPVLELKAFKKLPLKKGEKQVVEFKLTTADLSFYRADMSWGTEAGDFQVFVGTSSINTISEKFELLEK